MVEEGENTARMLLDSVLGWCKIRKYGFIDLDDDDESSGMRDARSWCNKLQSTSMSGGGETGEANGGFCWDGCFSGSLVDFCRCCCFRTVVFCRLFVLVVVESVPSPPFLFLSLSAEEEDIIIDTILLLLKDGSRDGGQILILPDADECKDECKDGVDDDDAATMKDVSG